MNSPARLSIPVFLSVTHLIASLTAACLFTLPMEARAELPTRSELLTERYQKARAQGLIQLNKQYLQAYEAELATAMSSNRLEEANEIKKRIDELKAENKKLEDQLVAIQLKVEPEEMKHPLEGKTLRFPHSRTVGEDAVIEFHEDGKALWKGTGNQAVAWVYEESANANTYYFWPPHQASRDSAHILKLNAEKDGGQVTVPGRTDPVPGTLERTR